MGEDFLRIEGRNDIVRETSSKAIINTDSTSLAKAKKAKAERLREKERIANLETKVDEINDTLAEILKLLKGNN